MKTQLDKWDNLIVFYAKGWFDKISPETSMVDELRAIMAERYMIDCEHIQTKDIVSIILTNIISPFLSNNRVLNKIIEDSAPNSMRNFNKPYDYYEAILETLISIIACTEAKCWPGLTDADEELFKKCLVRIK